MAVQFKKATKEQARLRLAIGGPAGAGKTFTALAVATEFGGKIAVIDTERGSASKYADQFEFDVIDLEDFHPDRYIEAIKAAERAGYDIVVVDSTTHEWNGRGGVLEIQEAQAKKTGNSFTAWASAKLIHADFIDAILQSKCHVIATVRSKTEYVQEKNDKGKTEVKKVGMGSVQQGDMDYEYDVRLEIDQDHYGVITKTRCAALDGKSWRKPGTELAQTLRDWLSSTAAPKPEPVASAVDGDEGVDVAEQIQILRKAAVKAGVKTPELFVEYLQLAFNDVIQIGQIQGALERMTPEYRAQVANHLHEMTPESFEEMRNKRQAEADATAASEDF